MCICIIVALIPPVAGNFADLAFVSQIDASKKIPIKFSLMDKEKASFDVIDKTFEFSGQDQNGNTSQIFTQTKPTNFESAQSYLAEASYDHDRHAIHLHKIIKTNPGFTLPFILGLEERARIIFFHVPMAWLTVIAFLVSMVYGIRYLKNKNIELDTKSAISSGLGLLFCILATVTGSIWAKFNWNSFWNWDPRETSIFVLLLVYGAYFALRSAIDIEEKRASLSAVYSIIAFVTVPFFIFIMPRIMPGLHPGSSDDTNAGPVMSSGGLNAAMRVILYSTLVGFIVLYAWLMQIKIRISRLVFKINP